MFLKYFLIIFLNSFALSKDIIVTTNNGRIKGYELNNNIFDKKIYVYKGIRYAKPPVGGLRFKKPQPVQNWTTIYNATNFGHSCWQLPVSYNSEDCLFLNIWSPIFKNLKKLKPVMFYIHGGQFLYGSGNLNGQHLASHDIVLVTINYRLGPFGFLYGGNEEAPGNVGLHDMILALRWVKDNIKSFGGNPDEITIFGQSAGSMSVGHLILSPLSRDLFKRAILQSGAPYYYNGKKAFTKESNKNDAKRLSKKLNCDTNNWLNCLKSVEPLDLIRLCNNETMWLVDRPIHGDELMPDTAQNMIKSGLFNRNLQILAGVTENEGTFYSSRLFKSLNNMPIKKSDLKEKMKKFNKYTFIYKIQNPQINGNDVFNYYLSNEFESNQVSLKQAFSAPFGHFRISCPTYFFAKDFSLVSGNPVYFYKLSYSTKSHISPCSPWLGDWTGVCHSAELPFVFGETVNNQTYSNQERDFSLLLMGIWTNFAKTGKPLSASMKEDFSFNNIVWPLNNIVWPLNNIVWPLFKSTEDNTTRAMSLDPKRFGQIIIDPLEVCEHFWKPYLL